MPEQPLSGLRVIETGSWIPAYAGHILAEAGADVVRVVPASGDPLATEPPFFGNTRRSIQETWYNLGKRTVTGADSGDPLLGLGAAADVLLEDWTSPAVGAARAPRTRVRVTPFGEGGGDVAANDLVFNALSGAASVTGDSHTPPLTGYGNQAYHTVGMYAAICALAANRAAQATGEPQTVDLSAHEALVSCTEQVLMQWFFPMPQWPKLARRQGSLHWSGAYQVTGDRNGDGMMFTVALRFMEEVLPWMAADGMAGDFADRERYPDVLSIVRDMANVMAAVRRWIATKDAGELFLEAQARHLSWGASVTMPEAIASPQVAARGYLVPRDVADVGPVQLPGRLFRTDADGPAPTAALPAQVLDLRWETRSQDTAPAGHLSPAGPLEGLRVFDFTHVLAGPFGTRVLGDLGAEIIKVGTALRAGGANNANHPYYASWNRNKKSIMLNLADPRGIEVARRIAAVSDAIVENFSAGVLAKWGLDRAGLADTNPRITVVSMGGMGKDGPWKRFVTFAPTIHALCGLTYMTNPPGEKLIGYGFSLTDHLSGLAGAIAILEGVEHARRTGQGLDVDLSQYEVGLNLMAPGIIDVIENGTDPKPSGNRHPFSAWAPHGIYRAAGDDRWVAIAVRGDAEWQRLCEVMQRPELASDPRFTTHPSRIANEDALDATVEDWTHGLDRYEVMRLCQAAGIAAGAAQDAEDLTAHDGALRAREFFGMTEASGGSPSYPIDRFPARFNGSRPPVYRSVHQLDADTFEFLTTAVGMDDAEVAELAAEGVLT
jgi:crotonobetainyl-CoA:carnitine CoA-transferase CaiB-like acyl-CoA transferase